ncbi:WhiB family transcriptional regulator [Jatrophihabitans endophyticus]|uniref:WhiB family transcriptional regulator n=1 Tax=Jatrophihabitans endophyticus TaxID=1206085 RepID=UPI0019F603EF|nr:WhiB family transcriptional regulator [Jatrophihabitans endophyticus]MBE7187976.1 WhiB family transcriptional regulator [Jatrophihabitans endophyticus]
MAPDVISTAASAVLDPAAPAIDALDPLSKQCPDDLPCRVQDAELWFADTPSELEQAKSLCRLCPARLVCLSGALERREPWGVWGGEIFERGAIVARKRPRGRPRKSESTEVAA